MIIMPGSEKNVTIQPWNDPVFRRAGIRVDVLRLDLLHPEVSGNKWLKLSGYLQQAKAKNKAGILTKGGPWSNHAHACAYACKALQLSCTLWIMGHEKKLTATIQDCIKWGAAVNFVNRQTFYDELPAVEYARSHNYLYIALGGAGKTGIEGVAGYLEALELPAYTHAVCATGTATTLAGLAFTPKNFTHVIGIESGTKDATLGETVAGWQHQLPHKKLALLHQFSFGGYSKYTGALIDFMNTLSRQHGIPTDIVYTSKLFYAVRELAGQSHFKPDSRLLVIHSGGLQGNRSLPPAILQF